MNDDAVPPNGAEPAEIQAPIVEVGCAAVLQAGQVRVGKIAPGRKAVRRADLGSDAGNPALVHQ